MIRVRDPGDSPEEVDADTKYPGAGTESAPRAEYPAPRTESNAHTGFAFPGPYPVFSTTALLGDGGIPLCRMKTFGIVASC
jgi:hypothetical protein